jgi:hypothetical protein
MSSKAQSEAAKNGVKVNADGNQQIDSMMEKPKAHNDETESGDKTAPTKREKEPVDEGGKEDGEERPSKAAKKEENSSAVDVHDAEKVKEPASEEKAAVLEPGEEEDEFKIMERGQ